MANKLIVSAAPHITSADSTSKIMGRVCIALLPTLIASVLIFGFQALLLTAVTVAACVVFEYAYCKLVGRDVTISDLSAVVSSMCACPSTGCASGCWNQSHEYFSLCGTGVSCAASGFAPAWRLL